MKKLKYLVGLAVLFAGLNSCDDFLDTKPYGSLSSEMMFSTSSLAEGVLNGVYNNLYYDYIAGTSWNHRNWDAFASVLDPWSISDAFSYLSGTILTNNDLFSTYWSLSYEGINRANDIIMNIDKVPDMTEDMKARRMSEAKFLRAYYYYKLNAFWRGVPIYLENLSSNEYTKPRSSEEEVWNQIINDLTDCINCASLPNKYSATDADYGRITKGAAYALRGKAYMWLKKWSEAEKDFLRVGNCGYSLFNGSYSDLFKVENEKCDEMIFSVQMIERPNYGNSFAYTYGNYCTAGYGFNAYTLNTNFIESYGETDGSKFNWEKYLPNYYSMTPKERSVYFLRDNITEKEKQDMINYGADMSKYLPDGNESRILKAYANRDPRLAATAITPYSKYVGGSAGSEQTYTYRFPYRGMDDAGGYDVCTQHTTNFQYLMRKFVPVGRQYLNVNYNPLDVPIIRYADVLLSLAECLNEEGDLNEAISYVNMVRERAGVAPLSVVGQGDTYVPNSDDLRTRIQNEKKWELVGEYNLYFEELRWGTWKDSKFAIGNGLLEIWGLPLYQYFWGGDAYYKWAVPQAEIERNSNLVQNDYWQ